MNEKRIAVAVGQANHQAGCESNPAHRILVVDDDISIRRLTTEMLVQSGYCVDTAEDGSAAWAALQINSYDLLVTDNSMPKVSGIELVKKVRSARMALPTILMSGAMPTEELEQNPWLQIKAMLLKPYTTAELLGTVREVLRATDGAQERMASPSRQSWQSTVGS